MAKKELTKRITKIIEDGDKLVQDVERGVGRIIAGVKELKELGGKSEDEEKE